MPMVRDAEYAKTTGGIVSSTVADICRFVNYSFDVKFEGIKVCRLGDQLFNNNKNTMG